MIQPCNFRFSKPKNGIFVPTIGCIGSGKSVFTTILGEVIKDQEGQCQCFYEPAAKEDGEASVFLPDFYKDQKRWGFTVQVEMLTKRFAQHKHAQALCYDGVSCVADSVIWSDGVFVNLLEKEGKINHNEADLYYRLFGEMCESLVYPSAIIYLSITPEKALERINKRMTEKAGRAMESGIPLSYLQGLISEYNELTAYLSRFCFVTKLDWNEDRTLDDIKSEAQRVYGVIKANSKVSPIGCQIGV